MGGGVLDQREPQVTALPSSSVSPSFLCPSLALLFRLFSNSWAQAILLPQSLEQLGRLGPALSAVVFVYPYSEMSSV